MDERILWYRIMKVVAVIPAFNEELSIGSVVLLTKNM